MAIIHNGILGNFSKSIFNISGGKSFNKSIIRSKTIPSNPRSSAQTLHRNKFSYSTHLAKQFVSNCCPLLWNPFALRSSGYANLLKEFFSTLDENGHLTLSTRTSIGILGGANVYYHDYWADDGLCDIDYLGMEGDNVREDDLCFLMCYDKINRKLFFRQDDLTRNFGTCQMYITPGLNFANLIGYVAFSQNFNGNYIVSSSNSFLFDEGHL